MSEASEELIKSEEMNPECSQQAVSSSGDETGTSDRLRPVRHKKPNTRYTDLMSELEPKKRRTPERQQSAGRNSRGSFMGYPGTFDEMIGSGVSFARKSVLVGAVPQRINASELIGCLTAHSDSTASASAYSSRMSGENNAPTAVGHGYKSAVSYTKTLPLEYNSNFHVQERTLGSNSNRKLIVISPVNSADVTRYNRTIVGGYRPALANELPPVLEPDGTPALGDRGALEPLLDSSGAISRVPNAHASESPFGFEYMNDVHEMSINFNSHPEMYAPVRVNHTPPFGEPPEDIIE